MPIPTRKAEKKVEVKKAAPVVKKEKKEEAEEDVFK